jgi:transcriptional regulator with XRE-family HTH domain
MNLGNAIQMCRVRKQWSQSELAERAGCSVSYLSMLENSKRDPTLSTVQKISDALGVPIEILFFLAADNGELAGINKELAGQLAMTALELISERPSAA